ncbi:hypothetical protein ACVXG7_25570 [Enterobacter hormaechei]
MQVGHPRPPYQRRLQCADVPNLNRPCREAGRLKGELVVSMNGWFRLIRLLMPSLLLPCYPACRPGATVHIGGTAGAGYSGHQQTRLWRPGDTSP